MSELTEIANDNDQGLEIEYDEDLKRVVLDQERVIHSNSQN